MVFDRSSALSQLAARPFDVVVVGGGITGAGVALDAASRGLRTALVERDDFASGTSSKSSKLVHGGLRYLQQREFALVYEALAERQRLRHTAPHLVRLLPFLIPVMGSGGVVNPRLAKALRSALWLYDLTGGARIGKLHERITATETVAHMPSLRPDRVVSGFIYYDAQTDDARLTLTLARTAAAHGAVVANRCGAESILKDVGGDVRGVVVRPTDGGTPIEVGARVVVNAGGVWNDELRALDEGRDPASIRPAKGVHITLPWALVRNDIAAVLPVPKDKRSIFVVPQGDRTYVGTTDTDHDGALDEPVCTAEDVDYLLAALNASLAEPLTRDDVVGTWAGLRPLVKSDATGRTADLSRRHTVGSSPSGVITVTGGKLTTYRRMAVDAVDAAVERLGAGGRSTTARLRLHGAAGFDRLADDLPGAAERLGLPAPVLDHLAHRYGGDARTVAAMVRADGSLAEPLVEGLPYLRAEAVFAARYEMAQGLDDVLSRRIPLRWLDAAASADVAADTAALVAPELGWSPERAAAEAEAYQTSIDVERETAGLPGPTTRSAP